MTGAVQAAMGAAAASGTRVTVTLGTQVDNVGWSVAGAYGGISSTALRGATLTEIRRGVGINFAVTVAGVRPQNFFGGVRVLDGSGTAYRALLTANVSSFSTAGGNSTWQWGDGTTPVWNTTDSGEVKPVNFF